MRSSSGAFSAEVAPDRKVSFATIRRI